MSSEEAVNQIVADLSGTNAEKAEYVLSQRIVFDLAQRDWCSLILRLSPSVRKDVGVQMRQGDVSDALLMRAP